MEPEVLKRLMNTYESPCWLRQWARLFVLFSGSLVGAESRADKWEQKIADANRQYFSSVKDIYKIDKLDDSPANRKQLEAKCKDDDFAACAERGKLDVKVGKYQQAMVWFEKSCRTIYPVGCELGSAFTTPTDREAKDKWEKRGCDAGNSQDCAVLGVAAATRKDRTGAGHYFERGCTGQFAINKSGICKELEKVLGAEATPMKAWPGNTVAWQTLKIANDAIYADSRLYERAYAPSWVMRVRAGAAAPFEPAGRFDSDIGSAVSVGDGWIVGVQPSLVEQPYADHIQWRRFRERMFLEAKETVLLLEKPLRNARAAARAIASAKADTFYLLLQRQEKDSQTVKNIDYAIYDHKGHLVAGLPFSRLEGLVALRSYPNAVFSLGSRYANEFVPLQEVVRVSTSRGGGTTRVPLDHWIGGDSVQLFDAGTKILAIAVGHINSLPWPDLGVPAAESPNLLVEAFSVDPKTGTVDAVKLPSTLIGWDKKPASGACIFQLQEQRKFERGTLINQVRLNSVLSNNRVEKFVVGDIAKDSAAARLGLKSGDVLKSVNGVPMTDLKTEPNAPIPGQELFYKSFEAGTRIVVEVSRAGEVVRLSCEVRS